MEANYPTCYGAVRVYEGGNDDDPRDPGGRTSRGIIQREWDKYRRTHPGRPADVWEASESDIAAIYRMNYWAKQGCESIASGVDETVFDYGVHSGVGRSEKVLRRCLHMADSTDYASVKQRLDDLTMPQVITLIDAINDERLAFLKQLKIWQYYANGFTKRVASVRTLSHKIRAKQTIRLDAPTTDKKARGTVPEPKGLKKAATGGGAVASGSSLLNGDPTTIVLVIVGVVIVVGVAIFVINKIHKQKQIAPPKGWTPPPSLKPIPATGG